MVLIKLKKENELLWYGQQAIEQGWSRAILTIQIESRLYERQVTSAKDSNFKAHFPAPQSDLAHELLEDPHIFNFLSEEKKLRNRNLSSILQNFCSNLALDFLI